LTIGIKDPEVWAGINPGGCTPLPDGGKVHESESLKVNLFKEFSPTAVVGRKVAVNQLFHEILCQC
jgi:hypothetical protein